MRAAGMVQPMEIHYMDHLAPICEMMKIPLVFCHEPDYHLSQVYYPWVSNTLVTKREFSFDSLVAHYDVIFLSGIINRKRFKRDVNPYEKKLDKSLRYVHCPHGFSDKVLYLSRSAMEDITLVYGQNHLDICKAANVAHLFKSYVFTGNYRFLYYLKHRSFFDGIVKEKYLKGLNKSSPTILYAPTWLDYDKASTFYEGVTKLIQTLPDSYNLIIKPHPRLKRDAPLKYYNALFKGPKRRNVVVVDDFPPVYPLLAATDIYLGDASSIGYDFLTFNKPMFFLNKLKRDPKKDRRLFLNRCGITIFPEEFGSVFTIIEKNLWGDRKQFGAIRKEVYEYTFGSKRSFKEIKSDIIAACSTDLPWRSENVVPQKLNK